jgi:hypothetical protein
LAPSDFQTGLTQARLKSLLHYEPETGVFTWLVRRPNGVKIGDEAGAVHAKSGYRLIKLSGRAYIASRLAWLYMRGEWPENLVDHKDTNRANNAWGNLRAANNKENQRNCSAKAPLSGLKGVHYKSDGQRVKRWGSHIRIDGKLKFLGYFVHPEEARAAYSKAAEAAFGQFARA